MKYFNDEVQLEYERSFVKPKNKPEVLARPLINCKATKKYRWFEEWSFVSARNLHAHHGPGADPISGQNKS